MTALAFAARNPERLRTLVVAGITHGARAQRQRRATADGPGSTAGDRATERGGPGATSRRRPGSRRVAGTAARHLVGHRRPSRSSTPGDLRRIDLPAMVAVGDRDPFVPVDHAWGLMRQLPARPAARRSGFAARADGPPPGALQRGVLDVLPFHGTGGPTARVSVGARIDEHLPADVPVGGRGRRSQRDDACCAAPATEPADDPLPAGEP